MRLHSRLVLGLCGLSLASATGVIAAPPDGYASVGMPSSAAGPMPAGAPGMATTAPTDAPVHKHKGILARRHCVECQRALAKRQTGIDVPPPPGFANDPTAHIHEVGVTVANCPKCRAFGVIVGPAGSEAAGAPGFAVADGSNPGRPGFAVVNGEGPQSEPSPIGVFRGGPAAPRMAANGRPAPGYDPSVVATSIPPAQVAVPEQKHNRPHVIGHLFGISQMRHDMQDHRAARHKGEDGPAHASIRYDQPETSVSELPASMVYGKTPH